MKTREQYGLIAAAAAISMATIGVFSRYSGLPAETLTFFRLGLGALCLAFVIVYQKKAVVMPRPTMIRCLISGAFLAGFILFYILSMNHTLMANAIFMVYLGPVLATLLAWLFRHQRLTVMQWGLMGLALSGFVLMQQGVSLSVLNLGMVYASFAMLCYGGFIFVNGGFAHNADPTVTAFWQLLSGALIILPAILIAGHSWQFSALQWPLLVMVGIWPGFLALYWAILALKHLPTGVYGTITYLEPVAVSIFGWVLFTEHLSLLQLAGAALIVLAGIGQALAHARSPGAEALTPELVSPR